MNSIPAQSLGNTKIRVTKKYFKDEHGRVIQMRGVNLGGNSKLPINPFAICPSRPEFYNHRNVSFVNRPFPINKAKEHFEKLFHWGFTFVRLLVPWEAIEHSGPGLYDVEFIEYIKEIINIAAQHKISVFIDPHQDTFSRFSGGSGAPGWVFEAAGMNINSFEDCGAAILHEMSSAIDPISGELIPDNNRMSHDTLNFISDKTSSQMLWPTNATKLASATMFSLFFAGKTFAPDCKVGSVNIQDYLQDHFVNAYKFLAESLKSCKNVLGYECLNEPHTGYIGMHSMLELNYYDHLMLGECPTPLQQFALGNGLPQAVDLYVKSWPWPSKKVGTAVVNNNRAKAWLPGKECVWKQHKVWDVVDGKATILKNDYFTKHPITGKKVDFNQDFYAGFIEKCATSIQSVNPNLFIFFEPIPGYKSPVFDKNINNLIYAPHWYELQSVFNKKFKGYITFDVPGIRSGKNILSSIYFGLGGAKLNFHLQIKNLILEGNVNNIPTICGECGIPFDINNKEILKGNYQNHCNFLDAILYAMESNFMHFTLWNYNVNNSVKHGDHWNGEDFSIFNEQHHGRQRTQSNNKRSKSPVRPQTDKVDPNGPSTTLTSPATLFDLPVDDLNHHFKGGRVLEAVIRPYATRIAGEPVTQHFSMTSLDFTLEFKNPLGNENVIVAFVTNTVEILAPNRKQSLNVLEDENGLDVETLIYMPQYQYEHFDVEISVSDGTYTYNKEIQTISYKHKILLPGYKHWLMVKTAKQGFLCCK